MSSAQPSLRHSETEKADKVTEEDVRREHAERSAEIQRDRNCHPNEARLLAWTQMFQEVAL